MAKRWQTRRDRDAGVSRLAPVMLAAAIAVASPVVPEVSAAAATIEVVDAAPVNASTLRSRKRRAQMTPNERTRYQAKYAQKRRIDLVRLLSPEGKCSGCGETFDHESLTIQHAGEAGCSFKHDELNQCRRSAAYWREYEAGAQLEAMCGSCNSSDGYRLRGKWVRR
jgi:hypothetical protein